jgi:hypothetical protein
LAPTVPSDPMDPGPDIQGRDSRYGPFLLHDLSSCRGIDWTIEGDTGLLSDDIEYQPLPSDPRCVHPHEPIVPGHVFPGGYRPCICVSRIVAAVPTSRFNPWQAIHGTSPSTKETGGALRHPHRIEDEKLQCDFMSLPYKSVICHCVRGCSG